MGHHRFRDQLEFPYLRRRQQPAASPGAFLACPVAGGVTGVVAPWQQQLYQVALMHAQAIHQPSLHDRLLSGTTN